MGSFRLVKPVHGSLNPEEARALGLDPSKVVDFSASISPLGPPQEVWKAIRAVDLARYPDSQGTALRRALSSQLGFGLNNIMLGNGSVELIHLLARAYLNAGDTACIFEPTFGEYRAACQLTSCMIVEIRAEQKDGFQWDVEKAVKILKERKPKLVFLCNPNNPTGVYLDETTVRTLASSVLEGLLVLDEAYVPFVEKTWNSRGLLDHGNIVLLRSMTKDYALTALRLGYAVGPEYVMDKLSYYQPSWSVNALAQAAGLSALAAKKHLDLGRRVAAQSKEYLQTVFTSLGLKVQPSAANFLLVEVGNATEFRRRLLLSGICVRDCTSFGLPGYIRVGMKTMDDCRRLAEAARQVATHG
jgi:histidinol-phosphate aminotransferase